LRNPGRRSAEPTTTFRAGATNRWDRTILRRIRRFLLGGKVVTRITAGCAQLIRANLIRIGGIAPGDAAFSHTSPSLSRSSLRTRARDGNAADAATSTSPSLENRPRPLLV
jgi:hypothetical protein